MARLGINFGEVHKCGTQEAGAAVVDIYKE
jgi:hypothetical protein